MKMKARAESSEGKRIRQMGVEFGGYGKRRKGRSPRIMECWKRKRDCEQAILHSDMDGG